MRKYTLLGLLISTFFVASNCLGLQNVAIGDNQTKSITISSNELSRIFVSDDRIQNVRGLEGAYLLTKDAAQGQVYIKPTPPYQTRSFNLFVTTEKARNFNLVVTPSNISGQDIELKPTTPSKISEPWEKNSDYSQVLTKLITSMINDQVPSGYSVFYPDKKTKSVKYDTFTITLQKKYVGRHLIGEALIIKNRCKHSIELTEPMFYLPSTRAVTVLNFNIPANGQTMVFRVIGNE